MARKRTMKIAALNIRMHPHSAERYVAFFRDLFALKLSVAVFGDQHILMQHLDSSRANVGVLTGVFARFTVIDFDERWFDAEKLDAASQEEVDKISIPEHLMPNYTSWLYKFDANKHVLMFETRGHAGNLSPNLFLKYIIHLCRQAPIVDRYGTISINLISTNDNVDKIISGPGIERVVIRYQIPNPDDDYELEQSIKERLLAQHVREVILDLRADDNGAMTLAEENTMLARMAGQNGDVTSFRKIDNRRVEMSSTDYPAQAVEVYDPDLMSENQAFETASSRFRPRARPAS